MALTQSQVDEWKTLGATILIVQMSFGTSPKCLDASVTEVLHKGGANWIIPDP